MLEKVIEMSDKVTGESFIVKESFAWTDKEVEQPIFKTSYQAHSDGIGEVNTGEYLVDDTGYCSLYDILKRCLRNGVNPIQNVDGEFTEDEVLSSDEDLSPGETVPSSQVEPVDKSDSGNVENVDAEGINESNKISE